MIVYQDFINVLSTGLDLCFSFHKKYVIIDILIRKVPSPYFLTNFSLNHYL